MKRPIRRLYNATFRPHLPKKHRLLAGVAVRDAPLLDMTADKPGYKMGLIKAIQETVTQGDVVELVGFGRAVTTIHALDAGAASIVAYEGASEMIELGRETLRINRPCDSASRVEISHALVGEPVSVYGTAENASIVSPSDISSSDILILDCEGSEKSILDGLGTFPNRIICETHPERGVPTEDILSILEREYDTTLRDYRPDDTLGKKVIVGHKTIE